MSTFKDIPGLNPGQHIPGDLRVTVEALRREVRRLRDATGGTVTNTTIVASNGGGGGGGGTPADEPDLTPPPTPTNVEVFAGLTTIIITLDVPAFTQGHGPGSVRVYAAKRVPGSPSAVFSDATLAAERFGPVTIIDIPSDLHVRWHIWLKWVTADGIESTDAAGGINGFIVTTGTIGSQELGPLVVEAIHLADDAVTAGKIAVGTIVAGDGVIANGAILTAQIGDAVITNAKVADLAASKITAGALAVGSHIQSTGFLAGSAGWRIRGDGLAEFAAAHIRGQLTAAQIDTRGLDIKASDGTVLFSAGQNLDWTRIGGSLKPQVYRVMSTGAGAVGNQLPPGFYDGESNVALFGAARSYMLVKIRRADNVIDFFQFYDVYGNGAVSSGRNAGSLATELNNTGPGYIVVVYTSDEPFTNRLTGGLQAALYRCGASPGVFESTRWQSRGAYMLIGIGACGPGNAVFERYSGVDPFGSDGPDDGWIDQTFSVVAGNPIAGGNSLFQINGSNISTYIATAAIGGAYIDQLNANNISVNVLSTVMNGGSSAGIVLATNKLQVFDESNVRRVLIGDLS